MKLTCHQFYPPVPCYSYFVVMYLFRSRRRARLACLGGFARLDSLFDGVLVGLTLSDTRQTLFGACRTLSSARLALPGAGLALSGARLTLPGSRLALLGTSTCMR